MPGGPELQDRLEGAARASAAAAPGRLRRSRRRSRATGPTYDFFVEAAVKRFQVRNGLSPTGVVDEDTLNELNVSAAARAAAACRPTSSACKAYSGDLGERFVIVNIPAASVETVEGGVVYSHHTAGVGKIDRQSPIMQTKAIEINFNPYLDRAAVAHQKRPDPEDEGGSRII